MNLPAAGRRIVAQWVADIHEKPRYNDASIFVESEPGEFRHIPKGGIWNAAYGRESCGVTLADVDGCRVELKRTGIVLTFDAVDAVLTEAVQCGIDAPPEPMTAAEKKAAQRERARAAGLCYVCCINPVTAPKKSCVECDRASNKRAAKRRKRAKRP